MTKLKRKKRTKLQQVKHDLVRLIGDRNLDYNDLRRRVEDIEYGRAEMSRGVAAIEKFGERIAAMQEVLAHPTYSVKSRDADGKVVVLPILAVASIGGNVLITVDNTAIRAKEPMLG